MKYIGIGMIWLAVAIMVAAVAFATHSGFDVVILGAIGLVAAVGATSLIVGKKFVEEMDVEEE